MTEQDKKLLLKDLCARLPYGVIVDYKEDEYDFHHWKISTLHAPAYSQSGSLINTASDGWIEYNEYEGCGMSTGSRPLHLEKALPFLRPMSSMTDKEKREFSIFIGKTETYRQQICLDSDSMGNPIIGGYKCVYWGLFDKCIDWLNACHFDYRKLIDKGLALEAHEGMYEKK